MKRTILFTILFFAAVTMLVPTARVSAANQVVTNCSNDTELRADLTEMQSSNGGTLTFNCGTATITLTSQLPDIIKSTVIDGAGKITLSGNDTVTLFFVAKSGTLKLKNIVLEHGYSQSDNGGAVSNVGHLILENTTIRASSTQALFNGGAIATYGPLEITNSTLMNNIAGNGGAIFASDAQTSYTVKITKSKFYDNLASSDKAGGAISTLVPLDITDSEFARNHAGNGGAIFEQAVSNGVGISNSNFHDNSTIGSYPYGYGGALVVDGSTVRIQNSTLSNNRAEHGGAIFISPKKYLILETSMLSENESDYGGGIKSYGGLTMTNVTLSGNQASTYGGGLEIEDGIAILDSVTFSNNVAQNSGGSGIFNSGPNTQLYLTSVIITSLEGANCRLFQMPMSSRFNFSSDSSCSFGAGHDNVDLKLGPLANNGGPTKTLLPQVGSPAIDGGADDNCPETDQRGVKRPQGTRCDAGAVEVVPAPTCNAKPAAPTLLKPTNNAHVTKSQVKLDWNDVTCALKYKVVVKQDSKQGTVVFRKRVTESQVKTTALPPGHSYFWRVKACNTFGCKPSVWFKFIKP